MKKAVFSVFAVVLVAGALLLAGCGNDHYSHYTVNGTWQFIGMTADQAQAGGLLVTLTQNEADVTGEASQFGGLLQSCFGANMSVTGNTDIASVFGNDQAHLALAIGGVAPQDANEIQVNQLIITAITQQPFTTMTGDFRTNPRMPSCPSVTGTFTMTRLQ